MKSCVSPVVLIDESLDAYTEKGPTSLFARHRKACNFLVPVRALSEIFRAKFMALARKALPEETFP